LRADLKVLPKAFESGTAKPPWSTTSSAAGSLAAVTFLSPTSSPRFILVLSEEVRFDVREDVEHRRFDTKAPCYLGFESLWRLPRYTEPDSTLASCRRSPS
jgi:hypothetical protein